MLTRLTLSSLAIALAALASFALFPGLWTCRRASRNPQDQRRPGDWTVVVVGAGKEFRDVDFVDQWHGWAVTSEGVWRTKDGGANWSEVRKSPTSWLSANTNFHPPATPEQVRFLRPTEGWVVEGLYLIHTKDGGKTWQKSVIKHTVITACFFVDSNDGWCVGQTVRPPTSPGDVEVSHKVIYSTHDGGESWQVSYEEARDDHYPLSDVWARSPTEIWAVGGIELHTFDGGRTWRKTDFPNPPGVGGGPASITFQGDVGWMTTSEGEGYFYSADGGRSWEGRPGPPGFDGAGPGPIAYVDQRRAWATGAGGIYYTEDSGKTWTQTLTGKYDAVLYLERSRTLLGIGRDSAWRKTAGQHVCSERADCLPAPAGQ